MLLIYFLILKLLGEKGASSIKRVGEAAGIGERSHWAETNSRVAQKNAITFKGTGTI
jgi:hypothetical protein